MSAIPRPQFICPVCGPAASATSSSSRVLPAGFAVVTCSNCGTEWQWPRPTPGELARLYTREYFDAWGIQDNEEAVRTLKKTTFSRLFDSIERRGPRGALLDVGCATGYLLEAAEERGWKPHGIELSEYGSRVAKQRFGDDRIFHGRLEEATFADGSFAAITMTDLIEHVLDPVDTVKIVLGLLAPGGVLCITTPRAGGVSYHLMGKRWTQYKLEHLQYFNPESLTQLLAHSGFTAIEVRSWPKTVSLDYVSTQFARYRHSLISPLVAVSSRIFPPVVKSTAIALPLGDMIALATKKE